MKNTKYFIAILLLSLIAITGCSSKETNNPASGTQLNEEECKETNCQKADSEIRLACEAINGVWISESMECEAISKEDCDKLNGEFDVCASACRNIPDAQVCTQQCIQVCKLGAAY